MDSIDDEKIEKAVRIEESVIRDKEGNVNRSNVDISYIDTCAGDHVWRLDSGRKYLSEISEQRGKSVVGVTGHHKPLSY